LKINGTRQLLVYADDVNTLGGIVHIIKNTEDLVVVASKETGLEVNGDKTQFMEISRSECMTKSRYED